MSCPQMHRGLWAALPQVNHLGHKPCDALQKSLKGIKPHQHCWLHMASCNHLTRTEPPNQHRALGKPECTRLMVPSSLSNLTLPPNKSSEGRFWWQCRSWYALVGRESSSVPIHIFWCTSQYYEPWTKWISCQDLIEEMSIKYSDFQHLTFLFQAINWILAKLLLQDSNPWQHPIHSSSQ